MDCVCGCGKGISGKLADRNFLAASVALELLAWDKNRTSPKPGPDGREGLIARGADCYQRLLYSLHGEGGGDPDDDCGAWLKESAELRATRSDMNARRLFGNRPPNLSKSDLEQLDRRHPETSFTGAGTRAGVAVARPGDGDLVDQLERLRALRDDGVLTDDEFAAAKARLLGG
jgi:Short C-terminal domain